MEIKISSPTAETKEKVFEHIKRFCIENFKEFEIDVEGLTFKRKDEIKKEEPVKNFKQENLTK